MIDLAELYFGKKDFEPFVSEKTIEFHYGKHHRAYVDKVNELIIGTEFQNMSLEDIIRHTYDVTEQQVLYNNAGQVYNHNVYWQSFGVWERLDDATKAEILVTFGADEALRGALVDKAMGVFGSGWVWLVRNKQGGFEIITTKNGDTPLPLGFEPIFNIDVWEHAYYLDYQNLRKKYVENFISGVLKI